MTTAVSPLYSDPELFAGLLVSLKFSPTEVEHWVRRTYLAALPWATRTTPVAPAGPPQLRHASRRWLGYRHHDSYHVGPPWYECPDCNSIWQPPLRVGSTRPRSPIHNCR